MVSAGYLHIFDRLDRLFLRIDHLHIFYPKLSQFISHDPRKGTDLGFVNIRHTECGGVKLVACAHCGYYGDIGGFCSFDYFKLACYRVDGVDNIIVLGKVEPVCRFGHIKALVGIHPDIGADVVDTLFGGIDLIFSHGAAEGVYLAVKVCAVSVVTRYTHGPNAIVNKKDIRASIDLLKAFLDEEFEF